MAESAMEKTEAPTPRRLQEARDEGNVARSPDLTAAVCLLAAVVLLYIFGLDLLTSLKVNVGQMLAQDVGVNPTRPDDIESILAWSARLAAAGAMPIMLALTATAMLATVAQVGLNFTLKPLVPKLSKLSMTKGIKNMTDTRAAVRFGMSMGKLAIVVGLAGMIIVHDLPAILSMASLEVLPMVGIAAQLVFGLSLKLSALLLVLAILDYSFQKWHRMSELRMSKHEVKEEMRSMEGDPLVKQRRARVARQLAMQRMGQAVPKADVIVTNPTHFAVALQYHSGDMKAPKVIAKGADFMAMRIRQIGVAHGVPIVERKELARSLYRHVEIGHEIPPEFYGAVAEILAYVYRLSGRRSA